MSKSARPGSTTNLIANWPGQKGVIKNITKKLCGKCYLRILKLDERKSEKVIGIRMYWIDSGVETTYDKSE